VDKDGYQYAAGVTLKSLWNPNVLSRLTLYQNELWRGLDVYRVLVDGTQDIYFEKDNTERE